MNFITGLQQIILLKKEKKYKWNGDNVDSQVTNILHCGDYSTMSRVMNWGGRVCINLFCLLLSLHTNAWGSLEPFEFIEIRAVSASKLVSI